MTLKIEQQIVQSLALLTENMFWLHKRIERIEKGTSGPITLSSKEKERIEKVSEIITRKFPDTTSI